MVAIIEFILKPIRGIIGLFRKPAPIRIDDDSIKKITQPAREDGPKLTTQEFIRIRRDFRDELLQELAQADETEKEQLRARIAELEKQIANPEDALKEAQKRIEDLEALLERSSNRIGTERINEACTALERGDFSIADAIFAEVEAAQELNIKEAARAAYGRGEIAEEEVRWADAAKHYKRATDLDKTLENLFKAREFAWRAGEYQTALHLGEDLVAEAKENGTRKDEARALNGHGLTLRLLGRFAEAEDHYRQTIEIGNATIGKDHPNYAIHLNNLAGVVQAQGRVEEAEALYRQAIEIGKATIGEDHPDYAIRLNNLAHVVGEQGRIEEAETLFRQAIKIDKATIGEHQPDYAIHLNNLANAVQAQDRFEEAEALYRQAIEIDKVTLGEDHPDYATDLNNLAVLVEAQGRVEQAETLYRRAIAIAEARLGSDHPDTQTSVANLEDLLAQNPEE